MNTPCKICNKRRARRECPGVGGAICPQCCGTERENTVDCPSDCEHLIAARHHEQPPPIPADQVPNQDVRLTEEFISTNENLITYLTAALAIAMQKERAVDTDGREALDALIRTYRTLDSGLIYESKPQNPYAAAIQEAVQKAVGEVRAELAKEPGLELAQQVRDSDVLGTLVFLQRLELQYNNGRRRSRAFLDFLLSNFPPMGPSEEAPAASDIVTP